jgi:hypothetical protein
MLVRVTAALDERIGRALAVAAYLLREGRDWRAVDGGEGRVPWSGGNEGVVVNLSDGARAGH